MSTKTTSTTKQETKPSLVPRLRFPEFAGEWEERRLGDVATFHKGKGISKADISINGRTPCIRYGELYTVYGEIVDNVQSRTDIPVADLFLSQSNDVIIPASGETRLDIAKAACVIHDDVALGGDLNVIRTSHRGVFLSYYLNGPKRYDIAKVAQGDTVAHLYPSQLKKLVVSLPSEAEQQRIASCLSSLDELIDAQARKVDALKTHKKGLMQQLFPREGETQPRLRFPEFEGEWECQFFCDLYDFMPTNTLSRDQLNYENGPIRNIHYGDIHTKYSTLFRLNVESVPFVNIDSLPAKLKPEAYCREGDIVFADASEDMADVGKSIELVELNNEPILSGSHTILTRQKTNTFCVGFAGYLFKGQDIRAQIERQAQGTKVLQISSGRIAGIKVRFPRSKSEQQRIATCLSSLDELITNENNKLETYKTHKKGLMQGLFPKETGSENLEFRI